MASKEPTAAQKRKRFGATLPVSETSGSRVTAFLKVWNHQKTRFDNSVRGPQTYLETKKNSFSFVSVSQKPAEGSQIRQTGPDYQQDRPPEPTRTFFCVCFIDRAVHDPVPDRRAPPNPISALTSSSRKQLWGGSQHTRSPREPSGVVRRRGGGSRGLSKQRH